MSVQRFIKFIPGPAADWLQENHPNAFLLLLQIAKRANRNPDHHLGIPLGVACIGDYQKAGIDSRKKYRTALEVLVRLGATEILANSRKRKKWATGRATTGTHVKLLKSDIFDINLNEEGHSSGQAGATEGPLKGHEQEQTRKKKEIQETTPAPSTHSFFVADRSASESELRLFLKSLNFSEEIVDGAMVQYSKKPSGSLDNPQGYVRKVAENMLSTGIIPISPAKNRKYAEEILRKYPQITDIEILKTQVCFRNGAIEHRIELDSPTFRQIFDKQVKLRLDFKPQCA